MEQQPRPVWDYTIAELKGIAYDLIAEKEAHEQKASQAVAMLTEVNREIVRQVRIGEATPPPDEPPAPAPGTSPTPPSRPPGK